MSVLEYATDGEAKVARRLVIELLDRGYGVSVFDGEETTVTRSRNMDEILGAMCSTEADVLIAHVGRGKTAKHKFLLVWGNDPDGDDLIADCTDSEIAVEICEAAYGRGMNIRRSSK